MVLNLFFPPCIVAIVTTFKEMDATRWGWFALAYQLCTGYLLAFISYQTGIWLFCGASFSIGTAAAALILLALLYAIFRRGYKGAPAK
jgi:ferrous iron transport protein B